MKSVSTFRYLMWLSLSFILLSSNCSARHIFQEALQVKKTEVTNKSKTTLASSCKIDFEQDYYQLKRESESHQKENLTPGITPNYCLKIYFERSTQIPQISYFLNRCSFQIPIYIILSRLRIDL